MIVICEDEILRARLVIDIETIITKDEDNSEQTVRFLVEEDLLDLGYNVVSCEVYKG